MATDTLNLFEDFAEQLGKEQHNLGASDDVIKVALTNTLPVATQTTFDPVTNHAAPAAANGYPSGGSDVQNTWTEDTGTATLGGTNVVFTAAGGDIGPFRYAVFYNDTNATDMLIGWVDYGSSITLSSGETFTVDVSSNILTVA